MGSDGLLHPISRWTNVGGLISVIPFIVLFPGGIIFMLLFSDKVSLLISIPLNLIALWLYAELIMNSYITVTLQNRILTIRKPLRHKSFISRKKHHELVIHPEDWEELYYRLFKGGSEYYFRKDRRAMYLFGAEGFRFLADDLKQHFPDKTVKEYDDLFPWEVRMALKKKYPERVL